MLKWSLWYLAISFIIMAAILVYHYRTEDGSMAVPIAILTFPGINLVTILWCAIGYTWWLLAGRAKDKEHEELVKAKNLRDKEELKRNSS